jgi:predicted TIM-barrel fold metal-dependent hydrolase
MTQLADPVRQPPPPPSFAPAVEADYNQTNVNFRAPIPLPKVRGPVIDFHCHLFAALHAKIWFQSAAHYGIDCFLSMTPLEEVVGLLRDWPGRVQFIAVPQWQYQGSDYVADWLRRIEMFYNLGSRIVKFHAAPGTMAMRGRLDSPRLRPVFDEVRARKMMIMTHIGDPEIWYQGKYTDTAKFGTRDEHYRMWEGMLEQFHDTPWIGAHMGGNPENLPRLQYFLDRFPNLWLDCSATRWMAREISNRRDEARDFFVRNADRIMFGSDQVSGDDRNFDFLASRWWTHRKLWETAYTGPMPIRDPDFPPENQPTLRGLALPDTVLQKLYHDNAQQLLAKAGIAFPEQPNVRT